MSDLLSIIICSIDSEKLMALKGNISETVGGNYELIHHDNSNEHLGICAVYNNLAKQASGQFLCFVHEDVRFHTVGWGQKLINHLIDKSTGVIGVMGGRYKSEFGLGWRDGYTTFYRYNILDGINNGKHLYFNPQSETSSNVVCLDGAFLCCRKEIWQHFLFDAINFTGFHFYDIDFTFRIAQSFTNKVVYDIQLEHFSHGKQDKLFLEDVIKFNQIYADRLPYSIERLSKKEVGRIEGYALSKKLSLLRKYRFPSRLSGNLVFKYAQQYKNIYQLMRAIYFGYLKT